jgi:hypothetical protein
VSRHHAVVSDVVAASPSIAHVDAAALPAGFVARWSFVPSAPGRQIRAERLRARLRRAAFPAHRVLAPIGAAREVWVAHFVYAPQGTLSRSQRVGLRRLKDLGLPLLVVCATPQPQQVPPEVAACADALLWKDPRGYDISAYTIALNEIARGSPGATVYLCNDSVFGPMRDLRPLIREAPWDLTGLTAHHGDGNHVQTYAFVLKGVTPARLDALAPVLTTRWSLDWSDHVVAAQEIPLSRLAARSMSVGSYLYAGPPLPGDPMTTRAFELIEMGHPYLKKSLLGKMHRYQDVERVTAFVVENGLIDDSA